ncbi:branched-chain amino acid ABC transporter permease [uncultured Nisaea sp.]|jgi:branched-chain amino acid transport system permease protein|uniref:branched-chain amino acid ABC transporter permease n=1 Tax=uncultured Nisaea sp. TaxID=538215 RepID=UPI0030EC9E69|tara:strand:- start:1145 stop:2218 length:1074 start_codon:yes stop_codon:yes gene_type:complete
MLYRETGQFKRNYAADQQLFPIFQDKILMAIILVVAIGIIPFAINDYWSKAILLPFLIYAMIALGLNILVGYCGQISLGTGGFMAVGAYSSYKLCTAFPEMNLILVILFSGGCTAAVGVLFGLPSLRIKGFYLAVATLAAQFFLVWMFNKVPWFYNYDMSQITAPPREVFGVLVTGPQASPAAQYLFVLGFVAVLTWVALNLVRGRIGRSWMSIRDMDIAAELLGIRPLQTKLLAFAVSSFYVGIGGALIFHIWLGTVEVTEAFDILQSFFVLFAIIIGGLGSVLGSFLGAAFMALMPVGLKVLMVDGLGVVVDTAKHIEVMLVGSLIIFFLIKEPHGLARMWQIAKEKLRLWPFPY